MAESTLLHSCENAYEDCLLGKKSFRIFFLDSPFCASLFKRSLSHHREAKLKRKSKQQREISIILQLLQNSGNHNSHLNT